MGGRHIHEAFHGTAFELIAPAVHHGPDLVDASEVETCPVTVSASIRRTFWDLRTWRVVARLVATVVLPTRPWG